MRNAMQQRCGNTATRKTNSVLAASVRLAMLSSVASVGVNTAHADEQKYIVTLPTTVVEAKSESDQTQGYVTYDQAEVTKTDVSAKDTPQTIERINIQKNKNYGTNDLSSIVEGNAGVDAMHDTRGENITIRGFSVDESDIYRDGIRSSGQIRRSTANIERVEILKGPASVLYGRGSGGGVINMVSKKANFTPRTTLGVRGGSWSRMGVSADTNQVLSDNLAVRLNADYEQGDSFRDDIEYENTMISPSAMWKSDDGKLVWEGQYTYDKSWRIPDRNPEKSTYDAMGLDYEKTFAHAGDEMEDELHFLRSTLSYQLNPNWDMEWNLGYRQQNQDFDYFYLGRFNPATSILTQSYAWQETDNKTLSTSLTFKGDVDVGNMNHQITAGYEYSDEDRLPLVGFPNRRSASEQAAIAPYVNINPYDRSTWRQNTGRLANVFFDNHHEGTTHSLFAHDSISVTPDVKVSLGGRLDKYTFESRDKNNNRNKYDETNFSPFAGLVWTFHPDHNAYASYAQSYAPYGGNGNLGISASGDPQTFNTDPENNRQYEIGLKSDWLDGRLTTTAAAYQIEHYNIRYRPDPDNAPFTYAIRGEERSRGIDLSAIGKVAPSWFLRASLGLMDAEVIENKSNPSEVGNQLDDTSKYQGNVFVRYIPNDTWYGEMGVIHTGKRYGYNRDGSENFVDGFTRVDGLFGYKFNQNISGTLAVHNLFDKEYFRSSAMPGQPRSFMARVNYEF